MLSLVLTAALAATQPATTIIVTTQGRKVEVQSYKVDGQLATLTLPDGSVTSMRASLIDTEATDKATAARDARVTAAAEQAEVDRVIAYAERQRIADANAANRAKAHGMRGSMSVANGTAAKDVTASFSARTSKATGAAVPAGSSISDLRSRYKTAASKLKELIAKHDALVDSHNKDSNYAERDIDRNEIASLRQQIDATQSEMSSLESAFGVAQEAARKSGADAVTWRGSITGGV